jgi:tetratricopeptide (TPR) repeat protein
MSAEVRRILEGLIGSMFPPSTSLVGLSRRRPMIIATIPLLVLASAAGLWLCTDMLADRELSIGRALAEGRLDEASKAVERWLRSSPKSAEAHYLKARIAWAQDDLNTVDQELVLARELGYDWAPVARLRGLLLARVNQPTEAEPLLRQAFDGSHNIDPEVANALTRLYLGTFRLGEAAVILDRWSRELPGDARPYLLQTEIDSRTKAAHEVIIGRYRAALKRDPSLDRARRGLAEELRISHLNAEAAAEYALYLARKPSDPVGYRGAGLNALEMGEIAAAVDLLDKSLALAPDDPVALAVRGEIEQRQRRFETAIEYFDRALKADPFCYAFRYQRMLAIASSGKKAEAEAERQTIERLKNDQTRFDQLSRDLVRKPLDPELRAEAACWLMDHGREDEAVEWADLVLRSDPSHPAMNRLLADYYRKNGRLGLANLHEVHAAQRTSPTNSTR